MGLTKLATQAVRAAAQLRAALGVGPADAVCPFDLAERMNIVVRMVASPSIEGMYVPGERPVIFIGAQRPAGRRRFTCGHEIGHHQFGHGERIDEIGDNDASWTPEEFLAQRFAAALLMPKLAVDSAFARRGWSARSPTAEEVYIVAHDLGVGFVSLINHLERTLRCVPSSLADDLRRTRLPRLRVRIAGFDVKEDLVVIDGGWGHRPLDLEVGDVALVPDSVQIDAACVRLQHIPRRHLRACTPGTGTIVRANGVHLPVRVSRRHFEGVARYRYLEDESDDD